MYFLKRKTKLPGKIYYEIIFFADVKNYLGIYITGLGHENEECLRSHVIDGQGEAEAVKHTI